MKQKKMIVAIGVAVVAIAIEFYHIALNRGRRVTPHEKIQQLSDFFFCSLLFIVRSLKKDAAGLHMAFISFAVQLFNCIVLSFS